MPRGNGDVKKNRTKRRVELLIPTAALSTNKLYGGVKKRSWHYKKFRKNVFKFLSENENYKRNEVSLTGNLTFKMEVGFSSNLSDLSNAIKGAEDVLAEFYEFNDRQITRIELDKVLVRKGEEFMRISITQNRKKIDRRNGA